ncbi:hypothetical protein WL22_34380 [Burkholderia ubonensis]|uniref:Uncharacterized protein n=2 Tax=Burkholderia cepacia complex TaxID=87882 RepID=A0A1B4Q3Y6_BURCE|nr:hypothetical protein WT26_34900 [Burkholderia cepacia]AOK27656.1 hypothetical protein WK67_34685 [Burkholderia ubonensis]KVM50813.1 hypothetical protein WJ58_22875 [Burkholderia ubonensis]KVN73277.1 hypothetical protein WJ67_20060 [Burkholderia ubonensis]KVZ82027.1 hypothetical protein WL22_34380 [Burkholderia ubonensis]
MQAKDELDHICTCRMFALCWLNEFDLAGMQVGQVVIDAGKRKGLPCNHDDAASFLTVAARLALTAMDFAPEFALVFASMRTFR